MEERVKILCVDDQQIQLEVLKNILGNDYDVTTCDSGRDALGLLNEGREFEVLLSDYQMPEMDGLELCMEFKRRSPATIRLIMTGYLNPAKMSTLAYPDGVAAYVLKPLFPQKLLRLIEEALEGGN
jgi:CheY-like chemotaxis protein